MFVCLSWLCVCAYELLRWMNRTNCEIDLWLIRGFQFVFSFCIVHGNNCLQFYNVCTRTLYTAHALAKFMATVDACFRLRFFFCKQTKKKSCKTRWYMLQLYKTRIISQALWSKAQWFCCRAFSMIKEKIIFNAAAWIIIIILLYIYKRAQDLFFWEADALTSVVNKRLAVWLLRWVKRIRIGRLPKRCWYFLLFHFHIFDFSFVLFLRQVAISPIKRCCIVCLKIEIHFQSKLIETKISSFTLLLLLLLFKIKRTKSMNLRNKEQRTYNPWH